MPNDLAAAQSSPRLDRRGGEFDADWYASSQERHRHRHRQVNRVALASD